MSGVLLSEQTIITGPPSKGDITLIAIDLDNVLVKHLAEDRPLIQ